MFANVLYNKFKAMKRETQLQIWIYQKQARIDSGIITNGKTLKFAKRDIKRWKNELNKQDQT
tara:strand:+ start:326 stop:511 length:186 start_codon:yes stop_codon:yes gene_type:complete